MLKNAAGHLVKGPCTYVPSGGCTHCDLGDYDKYVVSFSGVNWCYDCFVWATYHSHQLITGPSGMNGTFVLTREIANPCMWLKVDDGFLGIIRFHNYYSDCTDPTERYCDDIIWRQIRLHKINAAQWGIDIIYYSYYPPGYPYADQLTAFEAVVDVDVENCDGFSASNSRQSCGDTSVAAVCRMYIGYGGSVTVEGL